MKAFFWSLFFIPLAFSAPAQTGTSFQIAQIIESHKVVIAQMRGPAIEFRPGRIFVVTFEDGKQCSVGLIETQGDLLKLDASICSRVSEISMTSRLEPSLMETSMATPKESVPEEVDKKASERVEEPGPKRVEAESFERFGLIFQYSTANKVEFPNAYVSSSGGSGPLSVTYDTEGAFGIGASYSRMAPQAYGFSFAMIMEMNREVNAAHMKGAGGSASFSMVDRPKFSILMLEGSLISRWDQFYIPLGLHLAGVNLTGGGNLEVKNGVGVSMGAGFLTGPNSSLELYLRSTAFSMKYTDSTGTLDYGTGTLTGWGVAGRLFF